MESVMDADGGRRSAEGHIKCDFGNGKGALEKGIMQAWIYQGDVEHRGRQVRQMAGEDFVYGRRSGECSTPWSDRGFGMMGWIQGIPRWADETVWRLGGRKLEQTLS